jgi:hypothetical protein
MVLFLPSSELFGIMDFIIIGEVIVRNREAQLQFQYADYKDFHNLLKS